MSFVVVLAEQPGLCGESEHWSTSKRCRRRDHGEHSRDVRFPGVAGLHRQTGVAVVGLDDGHYFAPAAGAAGGLQGDVNGFAAAAGKDCVLQISGGVLAQFLCQCRSG